MMIRKLAMTTFLVSVSFTVNAEILKVVYDDFTLTLDCDKRAAVRFEHIVTSDSGELPRYKPFKLDPNIPERCQQKSAASYRNSEIKNTYHRGHLVAQNHLDHSKQSMQQSNYVTNILPQHPTLNMEGWKATETYVECERDRGQSADYEVKVIGGAIFQPHDHQNTFLASHGVIAPSHFWKVVVSQDDKYIHRVKSWIIPNTSKATVENLNKYLVAMNDITALTQENFEFPDEVLSYKAQSSTSTASFCDWK